MDKFLVKRQKVIDQGTTSQPEIQSSRTPNVASIPSSDEVNSTQYAGSNSNRSKVNLDELEFDPGLRKNIQEFHPSQLDEVRRAYLQRGPCQPKNHVFPQTQIGNWKRRFNANWFDEFGSWLEYSISKDGAYCLCCYLFKSTTVKGGAEKFVSEGFRNWTKKEKLHEHVGLPISNHNKCLKACHDLMNQEQHIDVCISNYSTQSRLDYRVRLGATFDCLKFLLCQGLAFRGHDESEESRNRGNFLELLGWLANQNEEVNKVVLKNAPENHKLTSPEIQKDIINAASALTTKAILQEIGDDLFSILIDESRDVSVKEQMAVVLRYVSKKGFVIERFIGIVHVSDTSALSLKGAIDSFFSKHGLSISRLRGQGYDGASNMRGEFNGLKTLILKENSSAFYVHCFAHQLQLTLVAVCKKNKKLRSFFEHVTIVANIVGASCKRADLLRYAQLMALNLGISSGEVQTGRGLNQEKSLQRAGDTRWGSHYSTLTSLIDLFSPVIAVLELIEDEGANDPQKTQAEDIKYLIQTFEFAFILHMMKRILGITNDLSQALQRKDQDIVNAMAYVQSCKRRLQKMRDSEWESVFGSVSSFCEQHDIDVPNMEDVFVGRGRSRRNIEEKTNLHYYRVELFCAVIDEQLSELSNRFCEINTELLLCMACLDPSNSFSSFDVRKLVRFATLYPSDFSPFDLSMLRDQLENYIDNVKNDEKFSSLVGIGDLATKMVETKKNIGFPLVYLLVKLALLLPVATASVERSFSAMKIIKTELRNRMGDEFMNDCLVTYIEQEVFDTIVKEDVLLYFQNMANRKILL